MIYFFSLEAVGTKILVPQRFPTLLDILNIVLMLALFRSCHASCIVTHAPQLLDTSQEYSRGNRSPKKQDLVSISLI